MIAKNFTKNLILVASLGILGWTSGGVKTAHAAPPTAAEIASLKLPPGFKISVYAEVPGARSMVWGSQGTLFVGTQNGSVFAVKDSKVFEIAKNLSTPNGVAFHKGTLYIAEVGRITKMVGVESKLKNPPTPIVVTTELPTEAGHGWRYLRVGPDEKLYIGVGAPCNVCLRDDRQFGTILTFDLNGKNKKIYAEGIRNTVGFDWNPKTKELWFTDNGRDNLGDDVPPCELNRASHAGLHFGFPFCHGGSIVDPDITPRKACEGFVAPAFGFQAHVAPLGMRFYRGNKFPKEFHNAIFVAEHGSWNRSTPIGYRVEAVQFKADGSVKSSQVFLEGFLQSNGTKLGRPVDIENTPDGGLLVSEDEVGRIWKITYSGP